VHYSYSTERPLAVWSYGKNKAGYIIMTDNISRLVNNLKNFDHKKR